MAFFKKELQNEKSININFTNDTKDSQPQIKNDNKRVLQLFNADDIEYIIRNFPEMSLAIKESLIDLSKTLEETIDFIEDSSSEIIKNKRDFELSEKYRNVSIATYTVVKNIKSYTDWMQNVYDDKSDVKFSVTKKTVSEIVINSDEELKQKLDKKEITEVAIYEDLTLKNPVGFKLFDLVLKVEDWDDLLVVLAEVLNKNYKTYNNEKFDNKAFNIVDKKSTQNSFRDTAIEILSEYKISLDDFKILV